MRLAVASGLERAAGAEVRRLIGLPVRRGRGHVRLDADADDAARLVAAARVPARIEAVVRDDLPAAPGPLVDALADAPWEAWLPPGAPWSVRTVGAAGPLRDAPSVARLLSEAVTRHARVRGFAPGKLARPREARVRVVVRLARSRASVLVDLAGRSLHRRAGPTRTAAPLREDLAAGIAWLARVRADRPLIDPFCGSGTLIAEAAAVATGTPPDRPLDGLALWALRPFADVDPSAAAAWLDGRRRPATAPFLAGDADGDAVTAARATLAAAGLAGDVSVRRARASALLGDADAPGPGLVLTNPPWGRRHAAGARAAWDDLALLLGRLPGWRAAILAPEDAPTAGLPLAPEARYRVRVGTVDARLLVGRVANHAV